jgi:hypothetical protein
MFLSFLMDAKGILFCCMCKPGLKCIPLEEVVSVKFSQGSSVGAESLLCRSSLDVFFNFLT